MNDISQYQVKFTDENLKEILRTKCSIWTRVMGYHRNVDNFNQGKKSEYYSRVYFNQEKTENSKFCEDFNTNV